MLLTRRMDDGLFQRGEQPSAEACGLKMRVL